jgi:hypothetical protein
VFARGLGSGGCKRCSRCSIHYPPHSQHDTCEVCDEPTSFFSNVQPDEGWEEAVKYAKLHPGPRATADPHEYRFERYLQMGFNEHQAQALANATWGEHRFPLYWGLVQNTLDAMGDHEVVFDLMTPVTVPAGL